MSEKSMGDYLSIKETASLASVSYAGVKRDIEASVLPAYRIGRKYFISRTAAVNYAAQKQKINQIDGYTIKEVMEIIPLSYAFIMNLVRGGKLPAVKCGRRYLIAKDDFAKFVEENKTF